MQGKDMIFARVITSQEFHTIGCLLDHFGICQVAVAIMACFEENECRRGVEKGKLKGASTQPLASFFL
jgi:hypothetical protein